MNDDLFAMVQTIGEYRETLGLPGEPGPPATAIQAVRDAGLPQDLLLFLTQHDGWPGLDGHLFSCDEIMGDGRGLKEAMPWVYQQEGVVPIGWNEEEGVALVADASKGEPRIIRKGFYRERSFDNFTRFLDWVAEGLLERVQKRTALLASRTQSIREQRAAVFAASVAHRIQDPPTQARRLDRSCAAALGCIT